MVEENIGTNHSREKNKNTEVVNSFTAGTSYLKPKKVIMERDGMKILSEIKENKILIVTGSGEYSKDIQHSVKSIINDSSKDIYFLSKAEREPVLTNMIEIIEKTQSFSPEIIIAIGGGAVIDTAKVCWIALEYPDKPLTEWKKFFSLPKLRNKAKMIILPTTFGSGSEASSAVTFLENSNASKSIILSHELLPDLAILDEAIVESLPDTAAINSVMDALTHCIEGFVSRIDHDEAIKDSVEACKIIFTYLPEWLKGRKKDVGQKLLYASHLGGIVQNNCSVGLTHAIAHQLGRFEIPHGYANAFYLLPVMEFNQKRKPELYRHLSKILVPKQSLYEALNIWYKDNKLDKYLKDNNINHQIIFSELDLIAEGALKDPCYKANPVTASKEDIKDIIIRGMQLYEPNN